MEGRKIGKPTTATLQLHPQFVVRDWPLSQKSADLANQPGGSADFEALGVQRPKRVDAFFGTVDHRATTKRARKVDGWYKEKTAMNI